MNILSTLTTLQYLLLVLLYLDMLFECVPEVQLHRERLRSIYTSASGYGEIPCEVLWDNLKELCELRCPLPVAIFPVVFCSAVTCWMSGFAMPVVVLKQTLTVALSSGTLTSGMLGTTVATIGR